MMKKTVLITGASRGIGAACAIMFAMNNYNVAINYSKSFENANRLFNNIIENGKSAALFRADVSDRKAVQKMVDEAVEHFGAIDVLVNNAGISMQKLFTEVSYEQWENIRKINLDGTINCCSSVLPHMIKRHTGKIINISSIWGVHGASCEVHYSTTKAAIIGLTRALAKELGQSGITVNCIAPGFIDTDMTACYDSDTVNDIISQIPLGRAGTPTDIANTVLFLSSSRADYITGQIIGVDGAFSL